LDFALIVPAGKVAAASWKLQSCRSNGSYCTLRTLRDVRLESEVRLKAAIA
jgi:hypothetical protein